MGAAEGGEEVVEGVFVGDVDGGEAEAPLVFVAGEEVVVAEGGVEDVAGGDAGWVLVVILGVGRGDARAGWRCIARRGIGRWVCLTIGVALTPLHARPAWNCWSGVRPLRLMPGWPLMEMDVAAQRVLAADDVVAGGGAGDEAAVVAPVEADPGGAFDGELILDVGGFVVLLVVIDAEGIDAALGDGCACSRGSAAGRSGRRRRT